MKTPLPLFAILCFSYSVFTSPLSDAAAALPVPAGPVDGLQPGCWVEIPNSRLSSADPCPARNCAWSAVEGLSGIMNDWCGGTYDTDREQLIVWGGGHGGYAGNEVYTFGPMTAGSTPVWTRRTEPSTPDGDCGAAYPDGKPASTHTYNLLVYAPNVHRFFSMGMGSNYPCGSDNSQIWSMDMTNYTWDPMSTNPVMGSYMWQMAFSAYDAKTGYIWTRPANNWNLRVYNPVTRSFVAGSFPDSQRLSGEMTGAIDPVRHIMVGIGGYGSGQPAVCWDLDNNGKGFRPVTTGDKAAETGDSRGFQFHPPSGLFVAWFGGADVYTLKPPANLRTESWVWTRVTPASVNTVTPPAENSNGTYGRFRYCPSLDIFICVSSIDQNVFVYKLAHAAAVEKAAHGKAALSVAASPNPFTHHTDIRLPASSEAGIYNLQGRLVKRLKGGNVRWNPGHLPAGVYLLTAGAKEKHLSMKLLLQK